MENKTPQKKNSKKSTLITVLRWALVALLLFVAIYCAIRIISTLREYEAGQSAYRSIAQTYLLTPAPNAATPVPMSKTNGSQPSPAPDAASDPASSPTPDEAPVPQETAPIAVDFDRLLSENADCIGWLYCEDTKINYPIMQSDDNGKYLHRLFDGTYNLSGSLFMDYRNDPELSDRNSIIYGHSMKDHSMFATLRDYRGQAFYEAHPRLYYLTPTCDFRLDPIACATVSAYSDSYAIFETDEELQSYLERTIRWSDIDCDAAPETVTRIMTLSTCSLSSRETRIILVCAVTPLAKP